jgi:uncharacterized membrane protein YeiH
LGLIYYIDLFGILVFTISGALAASEKKHHHDLFSVFFTGFITAIGGGTARDVLLGVPVVWIGDIAYLAVILLGVLLMLFFRRYILRLSRTLRIFDTSGMAIYVVLGVQKCLELEVNPLAAIILGMISGIFGGVIRDTLLNEIPLIFQKELYATPCLLGALLYVLLSFTAIDPQLNFIVSVIFIIGFRLLAYRYHWSLPTLRFRDPA